MFHFFPDELRNTASPSCYKTMHLYQCFSIWAVLRFMTFNSQNSIAGEFWELEVTHLKGGNTYLFLKVEFP